MELRTPDEEAMVRVATANLEDRFADEGHGHLEGTVRRVVHEWYATSRVKTFVGVIAERHARNELYAERRARAGP